VSKEWNTLGCVLNFPAVQDIETETNIQNKYADMGERKFKIVAFIISLFIVFFIKLCADYNNRRLDNNHKLGLGTPFRCYANGRGNGGKLDIDFRIQVNGKEFESTKMFLTSKMSVVDCEQYFIGRSFPVTYYPPNPSNSELLLLP